MNIMSKFRLYNQGSQIIEVRVHCITTACRREVSLALTRWCGRGNCRRGGRHGPYRNRSQHKEREEQGLRGRGRRLRGGGGGGGGLRRVEKKG